MQWHHDLRLHLQWGEDSPEHGVDTVDAEFAALRDAVLGTAHRAFSVSRTAAQLPPLLSDIPHLDVVERGPLGLEFDPLELCALRLAPTFYDAQDTLTKADFHDVAAMNRSLHAALDHAGCPDVRFAVAEGGGPAGEAGTAAARRKFSGAPLVSCALRDAADLSEEATAAVRAAVAAAVESVMSSDKTVLRIEAEMTMRGIAVAEEQLLESAAQQAERQGMLRQVPVVGEVVDWLLPTAGSDEGLRFDLATSTLRREERRIVPPPSGDDVRLL